MSALVIEECLILQAFSYGETSKILRLLTLRHGVRSVVARGALRPRSRFGGVLEPFATGTATLYLKDGRDLQTLAAFDLKRSRQRLGADLLRFAGASLLTELVMRTGSEEAQPHLFAEVEHALDRIQSAAAEHVESTILASVWRVIARLGFEPALDACLACGRALPPEDPASFDPAAGGVRCEDCARGAPGRLIPGHARASLLRLAAGEAVPLDRTLGHWKLLTWFLDHHLVEGASLRSLDFLQSTLRDPCAS